MKKGFTLVEIMVAVALIALITALALPGFIRNRMTANETVSQVTLKTIASALETYYSANSIYPTDEAEITSPEPPYLNRPYCDQEIKGYTYDCTLQPTGYSVTATPNCSVTGNNIYTIISGALLSSVPCS